MTTADSSRTASLTAKIAKLLNQAERAGTEAESATFMSKAQELATMHSIDLAKARHATVAKEQTVPVQRTITLGVKGTRGLNTLVELFRGIAAANDVTINIAHNSTYVVAFGFAEDIDIAEALFASLSVQMASAVSNWKREGDWKQETTYRPGRWAGGACWGEWIESEYKPVTWLSARLDFQEAYANRVGARLAAAKREAEIEAKAREVAEKDYSVTSGGTELVLVEKRAAVDEFYRRNSRARGSYRGGRRVRSSGAYHAGHAAGNRAQLSSQTAVGGARKAIA